MGRMDNKLGVGKTMIMVLLVGVMSVWGAKGEADTSVLSFYCNVHTYPKGDLFRNSVDYVLADLMNVTPNKDRYYYYTVSPYPTATAYGHAHCSTALTNSDCANCLAVARGTIYTGCADGDHIGAQLNMVDCAMRYDNHRFVV